MPRSLGENQLEGGFLILFIPCTPELIRLFDEIKDGSKCAVKTHIHATGVGNILAYQVAGAGKDEIQELKAKTTPDTYRQGLKKIKKYMVEQGYGDSAPGNIGPGRLTDFLNGKDWYDAAIANIRLGVAIGMVLKSVRDEVPVEELVQNAIDAGKYKTPTNSLHPRINNPVGHNTIMDR